MHKIDLHSTGNHPGFSKAGYFQGLTFIKPGAAFCNHQALYFIAIAEGNKTYLSKDVDANNKDLLYKPFKDLSSRIAAVFSEYNPAFKFPYTLASSVIDLSHLQYFFMHHLPRLSDISKNKKPKDLETFLEDLGFKTLA